MTIIWNKVTWYSKLIAIIFFLLVLPVWTFFIGTQYEKTIGAISVQTLKGASLSRMSNFQPILNNNVNAIATTSAQLSDVATLYPLSWNWFSATSTEITSRLSDPAIQISNPDLTEVVTLSLPGHVWESISSENSQKQDQIAYTQAGWQYKISVNGKNLLSNDAEGDYNSITGAIREKNGYVQVFDQTDKELDVVYDTSGDIPAQVPVAPYRIQHDVFVSDWISTTTLLDMYNQKLNSEKL